MKMKKKVKKVVIFMIKIMVNKCNTQVMEKNTC